jgi:hypothetical protein
MGTTKPRRHRSCPPTPPCTPSYPAGVPLPPTAVAHRAAASASTTTASVVSSNGTFLGENREKTNIICDGWRGRATVAVAMGGGGNDRGTAPSSSFSAARRAAASASTTIALVVSSNGTFLGENREKTNITCGGRREQATVAAAMGSGGKLGRIWTAPWRIVAAAARVEVRRQKRWWWPRYEVNKKNS